MRDPVSRIKVMACEEQYLRLTSDPHTHVYMCAPTHACTSHIANLNKWLSQGRQLGILTNFASCSLWTKQDNHMVSEKIQGPAISSSQNGWLFPWPGRMSVGAGQGDFPKEWVGLVRRLSPVKALEDLSLIHMDSHGGGREPIPTSKLFSDLHTCFLSPPPPPRVP